MTVSENFKEYVLEQLSHLDGLSARRMFGGVAIYQYGTVFALISDDVVYLKVDETTVDKYIEEGSNAFKPFPNRAVIKSYYDLPINVLEDSDKFIEWAEESIAVQKRN